MGREGRNCLIGSFQLHFWKFLARLGCASPQTLTLCSGNQELAVRHTNIHTPIRRPASAVAAARPTVTPAALTTLILSVLLGLLSGAVWMQLT